MGRFTPVLLAALALCAVGTAQTSLVGPHHAGVCAGGGDADARQGADTATRVGPACDAKGGRDDARAASPMPREPDAGGPSDVGQPYLGPYRIDGVRMVMSPPPHAAPPR